MNLPIEIINIILSYRQIHPTAKIMKNCMINYYFSGNFLEYGDFISFSTHTFMNLLTDQNKYQWLSRSMNFKLKNGLATWTP